MPLAVALITEPDHPDLRADDAALVEPLRALGLATVAVPWGLALRPDEHACAILRSPWDYFLHHERFVRWCNACPVPLYNSAATVEWNVHKGYLLELQARGAARISPSVLLPRLDSAEDMRDSSGGIAEPSVEALREALHREDSDDPLRRLIVKPAVSGGAYGTFVLEPEAEDCDARLSAARSRGDVLVQLYEPRLVQEGEWSLIFIDGQFTHAVHKHPRRGDFRVQENHGGSVAPGRPTEAMVAAAVTLLARLPEPPPLYARVDGFEAADGGFVLVELELIEPELFLRFGGARALAEGIARRL